MNKVIEEEVYVDQSERFEIHERGTRIYILKIALYGLKQEHRAWYVQIDSYLQQMGFIKSVADPNLYYMMVRVSHSS